MNIQNPSWLALFGSVRPGQEIDLAVGDLYVLGKPWDRERIVCHVESIVPGDASHPRLIVLAEMRTNGRKFYKTDAALEILEANNGIRPLDKDPMTAAGRGRASGLTLEIGEGWTRPEVKAWYARKCYDHPLFARSHPAIARIMSKLEGAPTADGWTPSAPTVLREIDKNLGNGWYDPVETAMPKSTVVAQPSIFGETIEKLMQRCLFKALRLPKGKSTHALGFLRRACRKLYGLDPKQLPDLRTMQRRMKAIPDYVKDYVRYDAEIATRRHGSKIRRLLPECPLHTVEVDDLQMDCEVCDDVRLIPLGRPWLIMIRDRRTGVILGFAIAVGAPSFESFIEALRHAWQPKDMEAYPGLEWRFHGKFLFLVVDRAAHFVGHSMELAAKHLGFDIVELAPASPELKGGLEAANRYVNEQVGHLVPGTVMGNVEERKLHEPTRKPPMLKLSELRYLIVHFICTRMNVMPKKGIGLTRNAVGVPGAIWDREIGKIPRRPMMNPLIFDRLAGDRKSLTIQQQGVTFDYITYWSADLTRITLHKRHTKGAQYDCVRNANNLAAIWVHADFLEEPLYVPVCSADAGYATGLTKQVHELLKRQAKVEENEAKAQLLLAEHYSAAAQLSSEIDDLRKLHDIEGIIARIKTSEQHKRIASTITRGTRSPAASAELLDMVNLPSVPETEPLSPNASPIHRPPDPEREGKVRQYGLRDGRMAEVDRGAPELSAAPEPSVPTQEDIDAELERIAAMKRAKGWSQ
jgi:hypothetical protein